jgi:hypothetical protein
VTPLSAHFYDAPGWQYLTAEGQVYFVVGMTTGLVKVGTANNPLARLRELQCGSPDRLVLVATAPGGPRAEVQYHQEFSADHVRGEWFELSPPIVDEILALGGQLPAEVMLDDPPLDLPVREQRVHRVAAGAAQNETDAGIAGLQLLMREVGNVGERSAGHVHTGVPVDQPQLRRDLEDLAAVAIAWANALDPDVAADDDEGMRVDYRQDAA